MRLERLEISGFKSFSDRSELAFDQGVTAIVGPNGCGKSNVADAITWVLGEQSAKSLRGDKMEDVIFNGSDARKPGATAEVRLRLAGLPLPPRPGTPVEEVEGLKEFHAAGDDGHANGNGHCQWQRPRRRESRRTDEAFTRDVEVTRRLYRSGESEYLIDGEVCRLRDVHELLMDTGLGAKAYAIIEQGKIGMILSSRPTDRRQLIEEAAGITKYRSRRRAAELKLEAAQQNLVRIDDIVFEVEKQRGTLKRQAAKARRYKRLRDEFRRWEKVLFARRYRELAASIERRAVEARSGARARGGRRGASGGSRNRARAAASRADRGGRPRIGDSRGRARARAGHQSPAAAAGIQSPSDRDACRPRHRDRSGDCATSRLVVSRRGWRWSRDGPRRPMPKRSRDEAAVVMSTANAAHTAAQQQIEGLDAHVETARQSVYMSLNSVMAVRHVLEHTAAQHERVGETLGQARRRGGRSPA